MGKNYVYLQMIIYILHGFNWGLGLWCWHHFQQYFSYI